MRKIHLEILLSLLFVGVGTYLVYGQLANIPNFWNARTLWSSVLVVGWIIVSLGYYHQGWIVRRSRSAEHVSLVLPIAVFVVQCILFIKGIYYHDWSLISGALMVNSGVVFSLTQILRVRRV